MTELFGEINPDTKLEIAGATERLDSTDHAFSFRCSYSRS